MKSLLLLIPASLIAACTTVSTQNNGCDVPSVPAEYLVPCEEAILPTDASYGAIFSNYNSNVVGPWARCIRKDDKLVAVVKYQEEACAKQKEAAKQQDTTKHWWQR
jgi:hypothetical protein